MVVVVVRDRRVIRDRRVNRVPLVKLDRRDQRVIPDQRVQLDRRVQPGGMVPYLPGHPSTLHCSRLIARYERLRMP